MIVVTYVPRGRPCARLTGDGARCGGQGHFRVVRDAEVRYVCEHHARPFAGDPLVLWRVQRPVREVAVAEPYGPQGAFVQVRRVTAHPRGGAWRA